MDNFNKIPKGNFSMYDDANPFEEVHSVSEQMNVNMRTTVYVLV